MSDEATPAETTPAPEAPAPVIRYEWGPKFPGPVKPKPVPGARPDANVIYHGYDEPSDKHQLQLMPHDPAAENVPVAVHLVLYGPGQAIHGDPKDAVSAYNGGDHLGSTTPVVVTDATQPTVIALDWPAGAKSNTDYGAYAVLEFHDAPVTTSA